MKRSLRVVNSLVKMMRGFTRHASVSFVLLVGVVGVIYWAGLVAASEGKDVVGNESVFVSFASFLCSSGVLLVASRVDGRLSYASPPAPVPPTHGSR